MREYKFRAFDKITKVMAEVTGFRTGFTDGSIEIWYINKDNEEILCKPIKAEVELMQYTGLKDCDKKEIYEGDIVKHEYDGSDNDDIYIVERDDEHENVIGGFHLRKIDTVDSYIAVGDTVDDYTCEYSLRVIGNIYENTSLLEGGE